MSRHQTQSDRLTQLTNELELSTFLNKGILQTNSEYKIRIAELERENAVLRAAESRLSRTEDALEDAEKRLRERENAFADAEREWGDEMQKELELRERAEGDRDEWQERFERLWEGMEGWWEGIKQTFPGPSRAGSSIFKPRVRPRVSDLPPAPTSAASRPQTSQPGPIAPTSNISRPRNSRPALTAPSPPAAAAAPPSPPINQIPPSTKRRRRIQETPPAAEADMVVALPATPSPPPRSRLPSPPPRTGTLRLSGGRKDIKPPLPGYHSQTSSVLSKKREKRVHSEDMHIKIESQSPIGRRPGIDSDDDPLAMYD